MQNTWENKKGCKLKMLLILITGVGVGSRYS